MDAKQTETAAGIIHGLCLEVERISGQLQDARAWAALWKRAADGYRANYLWGKKRLERQAAEIERLRDLSWRLMESVELALVGMAWYHPHHTQFMQAVSDAHLMLDPDPSQEPDHDPR